MSTWKHFECPQCNEPFHYEPSATGAARIRDMELKTGRACLIMVECPNCPAMISLDRDTGRVEALTDVPKHSPDIGSMMWDMTLTEDQNEQVQELIEEGNMLMSSNVKQAEKIFRKAIDIRKHDPMGWYNIGVCRHLQNDPEGAEESYRHALRFDRSLNQAWNNLGTLLLTQSRLDEAEHCFDSGLAADPRYPKFYLGKFNVANLRGQFGKARQYLESALDIAPNYGPAREGLQRLEIANRRSQMGGRATPWIVSLYLPPVGAILGSALGLLYAGLLQRNFFLCGITGAMFALVICLALRRLRRKGNT